MRNRILFTLLLLVLTVAHAVAADEKPLSHQDAERALNKAVTFFRKNCSAQGGYVYRYSADLKKWEGEGIANSTTAWIQPPGTPSIGDAYLRVYKMTGNKQLLEAARETGRALLLGQLESGGWASYIKMDQQERRKHAYRKEGNSKGRNLTTFDDNKSQSALSFLMRLDNTMNFKEKELHEGVQYALKHFLAAQYPNGAWPQQYREPYNRCDYPVKKASYPKNWPRVYPKKNYVSYYTYNDNNIARLIEMMFLASEIYHDTRYKKSAMKAGDFILLSQMPEPQPAWAQQYNSDMHPVWARKFEPPAITGLESQGLLLVLMELYIKTGEEKYLKPIPRALNFFRRVELPNKKLARFYELKTDKPLFFTKDYKLSYSSKNAPTHYSFAVRSNLDKLERQYQKVKQTPLVKLQQKQKQPTYRMSHALKIRAETVIRLMDERGAWVESGSMRYYPNDNTKKIIDTRTFIKNITLLGKFIAASKK